MAIVEGVEQQSAEWLAMRVGCVTGSRMADVMARLQRKDAEAQCRQDYKAEIVCEILTGRAADHYVSPAMQWGIDNEIFARNAYEVEYGQIDLVGFALHDRINRFGASPDGLVGADGLVEFKCPNTTTHIGYIIDGVVPEQYKWQMLAEMACTGRKWCDFVSYDPRLPKRLQLFVRRLERDEKLITEMESQVEKFLAEVDDLIAKLEKSALESTGIITKATTEEKEPVKTTDVEAPTPKLQNDMTVTHGAVEEKQPVKTIDVPPAKKPVLFQVVDKEIMFRLPESSAQVISKSVSAKPDNSIKAWRVKTNVTELAIACSAHGYQLVETDAEWKPLPDKPVMGAGYTITEHTGEQQEEARGLVVVKWIDAELAELSSSDASFNNQDLQTELNKFGVFLSGKKVFSIPANQVDDAMEACLNLGFAVKDDEHPPIPEKKSIAPEPSPEKKMPKANLKLVEEVRGPKKASNQNLYFEILWGGSWYLVWDEPLFEVTKMMKGKMADFIIEPPKDPKYQPKIKGFIQVGETEFDSDGHTPVIQMNDPRVRSLF